ncbi:MAG: hypothetical protein NZ532_01460 [Thermoflexales bacterium]|nr:hypothetical protein [Thermoflexales bacterium]
MWSAVVALGLLLSPLLVSASASVVALRWQLPSVAWRWAAAAALTSAAAFGLGALSLPEAGVVLGGWLPVSAFGVPLALRAEPAAVVLALAWFAVQLDAMLRAQRLPSASQVWALALMSSALVTIALAQNLVTLLVGVALSDWLWAWQRFPRQDPNRESSAFAVGLLLRLVGLTLLVLSFAAHYNAYSSASIGLFPLAASLAPLGAAAIGLRLTFAPFVRFAAASFDSIHQFGIFSTLLLQHRLAEAGWTALPGWFEGWAVLSVGQSLVLVLSRRAREMRLIPAASAALVAALGAHADAASQAVAAVAWLVGASLACSVPLERRAILNSVRRLVGTGILLVVPLWVGSFETVSGSERWMLGLAALGVAMLIARPVFVALRLWRTVRLELPRASRAEQATRWGSLILLQALVLITSLALRPGEEAALSSRLSLESSAWMVGALGCALGGWLLGQRLQARVPRFVHGMQAMSARFVAGVDVAIAVMLGALQRLGTGPARVFDALERDGALAWLIALVLLIALTTHVPTP